MKHTASVRNSVGIIGATLAAFGVLGSWSSWVVAQTNPLNVANASGCIPVGVAANYLYTYCSGSSLRILDVSNPANPVDVGYNDASEACGSVALLGNHAYVATASTMDVLDISSPTNPVVVGRIGGSGAASSWSLSTSSHFVYVAGPSTSSIYDVSNPTNPVSVGSLPPANGIAVLEHYAYLGVTWPAYPEGALLVCDISDPANPTSGAFVNTDYDNPQQVIVSGNYVFLTAYSKAGFSCWVFDISTRTNPVRVNRFVDNYGAFYGMTVSGNYAYLVGYFVSVYDVSNPTNAHKIASVQLPDGAAFANTVTVCRNYAYVGPYGGINIYSLGTPAAPQLKMSRTYSNNSLFSWPAPNAAFALQQNSDLNTTNWVALALNPVTVGSENQVAVPRPPGNMFYRLSSQ